MAIVGKTAVQAEEPAHWSSSQSVVPSPSLSTQSLQSSSQGIAGKTQPTPTWQIVVRCTRRRRRTGRRRRCGGSRRPSPESRSRWCTRSRRRSRAACRPGSRAPRRSNSSPLQTSPSSQKSSSGVTKQPLRGSQSSTVQSTPSLQTSGAPATTAEADVAGLEPVADVAVRAEAVLREVDAATRRVALVDRASDRVVAVERRAGQAALHGVAGLGAVADVRCCRRTRRSRCSGSP